MHKGYIKLSLILIPFVLYVTIMFKMIDNVYQVDMSIQSFGEGLYLHKGGNVSNALHKLAEEYNKIENERKTLLQTIHKIVLAEEKDHAMTFVNNVEESSRHIGKSDNALSKCDTNKRIYPFNCSNIYKIQLKQKIGHGVSKQAYLGQYENEEIVVKMVTRHQREVRACLDDLRSKKDTSKTARSKCFVFSTMKLMKEILLLEQLNHEGFVELLGYCVRSEESDSSDLLEHGVVTVFEVGRRINIDSLINLPITIKIQHALYLLEFLNYLENSPLGSLRIRDFKEDHFVLVGPRIKMIDLDDVDNLEPSCNVYTDTSDDLHSESLRHCNFGLQCQMGLCVGQNAKQNLKSVNEMFFNRLLDPNNFPRSMKNEVMNIKSKLDSLSISTRDAITVLKTLQLRLSINY